MKCRLCGSENINFVFNSCNTHGRHVIDDRESFPVYCCSDCDVSFLGGINPDENFYKRYYGPGYYGIDPSTKGLSSSLIKIYCRWSRLRKEKFILKFFEGKKTKIRILDVGCGKGDFLESLDSRRFEKYGVEINPEGVQICGNKGLNVFNEDVLKIDFQGEKYDVVSLWHVLEHIEKPRELLDKLRGILSNDGILVFQTPNTDSLGSRFGERWWFHLDSPRHLTLFNRGSINKLCEMTGFKVIGVRNGFYDYPLDLFWSVRGSHIKFIFYPFYPLIKLFSRENLTYICRKI